jgi:uncharacterized membrane protein
MTRGMTVEPWLAPTLFALVVWSAQRVLTKAVLQRLSTPQFYLLSASLSLPVYVPMLVLDPQQVSAFGPALGVAALMAVAFWTTTEALRRGPVGKVSPVLGVAPALTAALAITVLHEHAPPARVVGIAIAVGAVALLGHDRRDRAAEQRWLGPAVASLALQGTGAFLAKVVVTPSGPSALLVSSAAVQVGVGSLLLRRSGEALPVPSTPLLRWAYGVLILAALATIGYLWALSVGPASAIVPLAATSPALAGLAGAVVLRERVSPRQIVGITLGLLAAVLLASSG